MPEMILQWKSSFSCSALHAARALACGWELVESRLTTFAEPAEQLANAIRTAQLPEPKFWDNLLALSAEIDSNQELVRTALRKTLGSGPRTEILQSRIEGRVTDVENAFRHDLPTLFQELPHRLRPLREQFEARGAGFLRVIARLTDDNLIAPKGEIIGVHPVLGGYGAAHLAFNTLRIEALLANPLPELPEAVRLGWLLAQLQCDLPLFGEFVSASNLPRVAQAALLPAALLAAQEVEWVTYSPTLLRLALVAWRIAEHPADAERMAEGISDWWETYQAHRTPWSIAQQALEAMLFPPSS